jgi:hypothetical protein
MRCKGFISKGRGLRVSGLRTWGGVSKVRGFEDLKVRRFACSKVRMFEDVYVRSFEVSKVRTLEV